MSTLIGIPYPMNSVGVLPLPYLNNTGRYKALAAFGNSKQILASFLVKEAITKKHEVFFQAFKPLQNHTQLLLNIEEKINSNLNEEAESLSLELIQLSLKGLNYYQKYLELIILTIRYDWFFLRSVISFGYVGWILFALLHIIRNFSQLPRKKSQYFSKGSVSWNILAAIIAIFLTIFLFLKKSPIQYYAYAGFPIFFWKVVFQNSNTLVSHVKGKSLWSFSLKIFAYIFGLEILVFSYFERSALSYSLIAFSVLVPICLGSTFCIKNGLLVIYWSISCLITSTFTFLPVSKEENIYLVSAGSILTFLSGAFFLAYLPKSKNDDASFFERSLIKIQVFVLEII